MISNVVLKFGKHKGKPLHKVPRNYLKWMITQPFLSDEKNAELKVGITEFLGPDVAKEDPPPPGEGETADTPPWEGGPREVIDQTPPKREEHSRQEFRLGKTVARVNGTLIRLEEIRSIRSVQTPVQRHDCILTHVVQLREGCLGTGDRALKVLWITKEEATQIENRLFDEK